jgi:ankyrin repeat protein
MFADYLDLNDINTLVRTTRALNQLLTPFMYRFAKDLNSRDGRPYFLEAVDLGNLTAVSHFIEVGTSVNMSDPMERLRPMERVRPTALHSCVLDDNIDLARLLIQHGVNMSPKNRFGWTPLHHAVSGRNGSETWVRLLVDAGADISASSGYCGSILYMATMYGTTSILQFLLQRGAIPTSWNPKGDPLLHVPVLDRTAATVGLFVEAGLNIDSTNNQGETPLHHAATNGTEAHVKELLEWGANVHAIDNEGRTPLQAFLRWSPSTAAAHHIINHQNLREECASKGGQACVPGCRFEEFDEPVVDLLLSAGADIRASRNSTLSPLDWAAYWLNI